MNKITCKLIATLFLLFFTQNILAQQYGFYHEINKAEMCVFDKNYKQATIHYKRAFKIRQPNTVYLAISAAKCFYKNDLIGETFRYLKKSVLLGYELKYIEQIIEFNALHQSKKWKKFVRRYPILREKHFSSINIDLYLQIEKMSVSDQLLRGIYFSDSLLNAKLWEKQEKHDSTNFYTLMEITKRYGWPDFNLVGIAARTAELIIWHQRDSYDEHEVWDYFKPVIEKEIKKGRLPASNLVYFEDVKLLRDTGKQKYGTSVFRKKSGETVFMPIEDIQNVDQRRFEVGLKSLKDFARLRGIQLPAEYIFTL